MAALERCKRFVFPRIGLIVNISYKKLSSKYLWLVSHFVSTITALFYSHGAGAKVATYKIKAVSMNMFQ